MGEIVRSGRQGVDTFLNCKERFAGLSLRKPVPFRLEAIFLDAIIQHVPGEDCFVGRRTPTSKERWSRKKQLARNDNYVSLRKPMLHGLVSIFL